MFAYGCFETSQYKWEGALFAKCINNDLAHHGHDGQMQLPSGACGRQS